MSVDPKLSKLIYDASVAVFKDWRKAFPDERVFAFALSTIDDAIYVSASLNSVESHERKLKERELDASSLYGLDAKWGPSEWENEFTGQSHFSPVDSHLKPLYEQCTEDSFGDFRSMVFDSMLDALLNLRKNEIVKNDGDPTEVILFATIYDSFDAETLHRKSAELLNPPDAVTELLTAVGG